MGCTSHVEALHQGAAAEVVVGVEDVTGATAAVPLERTDSGQGHDQQQQQTLSKGEGLGYLRLEQTISWGRHCDGVNRYRRGCNIGGGNEMSCWSLLYASAEVSTAWPWTSSMI